MVNNSSIINQAKNHFSKMTMTYDIGNPEPGLGQAHICGRINLAKGIPDLPSW